MTQRHVGPTMSPWWWTSFIVLLTSSVVFSVVVGNILAGLNDPEELGHSSVGEWADLGQFGFRARLDDVTISESFPSAYDEARTVGEEGASLLRVRFTIEPVAGRDEHISCSMKLFNADGEELTLTKYGVAGPVSTECTAAVDSEASGTGEPFETQMVWVVLPDFGDDYTLWLAPISEASTSTFWRFTL